MVLEPFLLFFRNPDQYFYIIAHHNHFKLMYIQLYKYLGVKKYIFNNTYQLTHIIDIENNIIF